ncbi:MAG: hypothetical protein ACLFS7_01070 [Desulfosudaceae bacterium]
MSFHYYVPGIVLIVAALLILAFPRILVALVAGLVFMAGLAALWMGNTIRHINKNGLGPHNENTAGIFFNQWRR